MCRVLRFNNKTINGINDKIWGNYNTITGKNTLIVGDNNIIVATNSIVYGNDNIIMGSGATVYGNNNSVSGVRSRKHPPSSSPPRYEDYIDIEINNDIKIMDFTGNTMGDILSNIGRNMIRDIIDSKELKSVWNNKKNSTKKTFSMLMLEGNAIRASEDTKQNMLCVVCMSNIKNIMLNPCSHVVYCIECARNDILSDKCPICRKEYVSAQVIFL